MAANREVVQRRTFAKGFTRNFSVVLDDVVAKPRSDLADLLNLFGRNASIGDTLYRLGDANVRKMWTGGVTVFKRRRLHRPYTSVKWGMKCCPGVVLEKRV
jgi:hypothetical protein